MTEEGRTGKGKRTQSEKQKEGAWGKKVRFADGDEEEKKTVSKEFGKMKEAQMEKGYDGVR